MEVTPHIYMVVFDGILYFSADDGNDGVELWMADDPSSTVSEVYDINGSGDSNPGFSGYLNLGDTLLYFSADDGFDGVELWMMDNVNLSPAEVNDINNSGDSHPLYWQHIGDTVIFVADDGSGWELWRSNGTSSSTVMIQNIQPASVSDTLKVSGAFNSKILFGADNGVHGFEPWQTDGKSSNTALLKDINLGNAINGDPQWFALFGSTVYFNARTSDQNYYSLFKTTGTAASTTEIKHASIADNFSAGPTKGIDGDSIFIFTGYVDTLGMELWKSDGTSSGTVLLKDIHPTKYIGSNPGSYIKYDSAIYFIADDGTNGQELWKTNGTTTGTSLVKDIASGSASSNISNLTVANNLLFFTATNGINGTELWASDGTTSGTNMVKDILIGSSESSPYDLFSADSILYFIANDSIHGNEVWTSDGTSSGTTMLKDINSGTADGASDGFASLGGFVYFSADSVGAPRKIWRTDGTASNTHFFYDVNFPFGFRNIGSKLVFFTLPATSMNGFHIWSTDGTTSGTIEVEDFLPGNCNYIFLEDYPVHNGRVYYRLDDEISGQELWVSDGSVAGTTKYDIAPGPASSYAYLGVGLNPYIFSADDGSNIGREPYALNLPTPLPLSTLQLNAQKHNQEVLLRWTSQSFSEQNFFGVERSGDGQNFMDIGYVKGNASKSQEESLQYNDHAPLSGINYYRIRRQEINGKIEYSNVCKLSFEILAQAVAFPNPTQDVLHINAGRIISDGVLTVRAINGQLAFQITVTGTDVVTIPTSNLSPGLYQAELNDRDGFHTQVVFVKQ